MSGSAAIAKLGERCQLSATDGRDSSEPPCMLPVEPEGTSLVRVFNKGSCRTEEPGLCTLCRQRDA